MNIRFVVGGLVVLVVSSLAALAETPYFADEIDITAAVREAGGAEKPVLEQDECAAYTVDNAFGAGETKEDRILLKGQKSASSGRLRNRSDPVSRLSSRAMPLSGRPQIRARMTMTCDFVKDI